MKKLIEHLKYHGLFGYSVYHLVRNPHKIIKQLYLRVKWAWQRVFRGWDDRVIWDVDYHLAKMIPVWIMEIKKFGGIPCQFLYDEEGKAIEEDVAVKQYHGILDQVITGFVCYQHINDMCVPVGQDKVYQRLYEQGMALFVEHFPSFWT